LKCPNCEDEIKLEYGTKLDSTMQYQYWWCSGCEKKVDPTQEGSSQYWKNWCAGFDTWLDEQREPQMRTNKGED